MRRDFLRNCCLLFRFVGKGGRSCFFAVRGRACKNAEIRWQRLRDRNACKRSGNDQSLLGVFVRRGGRGKHFEIGHRPDGDKGQPFAESDRSCIPRFSQNGGSSRKYGRRAEVRRFHTGDGKSSLCSKTFFDVVGSRGRFAGVRGPL